MILSTKAFPEHRRPAWLLDPHRWFGELTVSFVAIHLGALVADSYTHFNLNDLSPDHPAGKEPPHTAQPNRSQDRKAIPMELDDLFGIPAHPLVVHAAVVAPPAGSQKR